MKCKHIFLHTSFLITKFSDSSRILQNPEILRQLQNFQQMQAQQEEEKRRKLQEMKQQEEEFDKHLAQTVPVS